MDTDNRDNYSLEYIEVYEACQKYKICPLEKLQIISYTSLPSILQVGPQCGIVAAAMCTGISVETLMQQAISSQMTKNGEMFSVKYLAKLIELNLTEKNINIYDGDLLSEKSISVLKNNGLVLVPYDADGNHAPCCKHGHKAHWAVLCGLIQEIDFPESLLVVSRHGKSKHLAFWDLNELALSNSQLDEFSPSRRDSNLTYILPEEGISGPNGLKKKAIFITHR